MGEEERGAETVALKLVESGHTELVKILLTPLIS